VPELEYIFKHHLTQQAAYNGLLRRERRQFHRQVAEAWERLFPDRIDEQLGLLAHHREQAGDRERAVDYLGRAGEQAAAQFANAEAVGYFTRALELTPGADLAGRYELLLARERVYDMQGAREVQYGDLVTLQELAEALNDDTRRAEVARRQARYGIVTSDYAGAIAAAQRVVCLARNMGDVSREVVGHQYMGVALYDQQDFERAGSSLEQALTLARAAGLRQAEAESLRRLGIVRMYQGESADSRVCYEQALRIFRELDDREGEGSTLLLVAVLAGNEGSYGEARAVFEERLRAMRDTGNRRQEGFMIRRLGRLSHDLGDYHGARTQYEQALRIIRETGWRFGEQGTLTWLGLLFHHLGDDEAARQHCEQSLLVGQGISGVGGAGALTTLGHALAGLGRLDEAADAYREALALQRDRGLLSHHRTMETLAGLARVCVAQGNPSRAQEHVEEILSYLETGNLARAREPFRVYLTCYRVLQANGDPRADDVLQRAHALLQERVARISDEGERRSFLENVAANRELVEEWTRGRRTA